MQPENILCCRCMIFCDDDERCQMSCCGVVGHYEHLKTYVTQNAKCPNPNCPTANESKSVNNIQISSTKALPTVRSRNISNTASPSISIKLIATCVSMPCSSLQVSLNTTIKEIRLEVSKMLNTQLDRIILFCGSKSLETDWASVKDSGLVEGSTVLVSVGSMYGGGDLTNFSFINVLADKSEKHSFSTNGPKWQIACDGLMLEGICKNYKCEAYNQIVFCKIGYGIYMLGVDESPCPMCLKDVKVEDIRKPWFYKCVVIYRGFKDDGTAFKTPPKRFEELHTYNEKDSGVASFERLCIEVQKLV